MPEPAQKRFVIVGGGTAGWLAAFVLADAAKRKALPIAITVVESSKIPTIGVGEGTTAVFRMLLKNLGIDEMEFLRETEATIKFGIRHKNWRGDGLHYDGPIDDPHQVIRAARRRAERISQRLCRRRRAAAAGHAPVRPADGARPLALHAARRRLVAAAGAVPLRLSFRPGAGRQIPEAEIRRRRHRRRCHSRRRAQRGDRRHRRAEARQRRAP